MIVTVYFQISYIGKKLAPLLPQPGQSGAKSTESSESAEESIQYVQYASDDDSTYAQFTPTQSEGVVYQSEDGTHGDSSYQYTYENAPVEQEYDIQYDTNEYSKPDDTGYEIVQYDETGDHITVSNPARMETLEEMQARIAEEVRSKHTTPVQPGSTSPPQTGQKLPVVGDVAESKTLDTPNHPFANEQKAHKQESDDEAGDLIIDEPETSVPIPEPESIKCPADKPLDSPIAPQKVGCNRPEPIRTTTSTPSKFSVPESPIRTSAQSTPLKSENRLPSGPHISTDSEATPTKPKHIRMSTSSEDSVFFGSVRRRSRDDRRSREELTTKPVKPIKTPAKDHATLDDSYSADSEEEMDSDFDDMPDLEETPTDTFMEDLPTLEELPVSIPVKSRKRKSLPNSVKPPQMSPVKRHRRGIRRSKSAAESYVQLQTRIK